MRRGLLFALLASCASAPAKPPAEEGDPAVIVEASPRSRAALLQAFTDLLGGAQPLLADDALTRESALVITRRHSEGRDSGTPAERFMLVKIGGRCALLRESTGQRAFLVETKCVAR